MLHRLPYALAFLLLIPHPPSRAQSVAQADRLGRPSWIFTPIPARADSLSGPDSPSIREARSRMFDTPGATPLIAHDLLDYSRPSGGGADFSVTRDPIPTKMSDVVAIVQIASTQPFLSSDKAMVYSELYGTVIETLVDKQHLAKDSSVVIIERGGTLQLPSGKVLTAMPYGGTNPLRIGTRYLLFLQYKSSAEAYVTLRAWSLAGTKPQELDDDGQPLTRPYAPVDDAASTEVGLKEYIMTHQR